MVEQDLPPSSVPRNGHKFSQLGWVGCGTLTGVAIACLLLLAIVALGPAAWRAIEAAYLWASNIDVQVQDLESPDGRFVAQLTTQRERPSGALLYCRLVLRDRGSLDQHGHPEENVIFSGDKTSLHVVWQDERTLVIEYEVGLYLFTRQGIPPWHGVSFLTRKMPDQQGIP